MGFPYNELVAPAVLWINPGITREEFVKLLDETHSADFHEYKDESWDYHSENTDDPMFHRGLGGLASILGLENNPKFNDFQQARQDENDLWLPPPQMLPARDGADYKYDVTVSEKYVFEEPQMAESCSWDRLSVGEVWTEPQIGCKRGIVLEIFSETDYKKERNYDEDDDFSGPQYGYKMKIRPFYCQGRKSVLHRMKNCMLNGHNFIRIMFITGINQKVNYIQGYLVEKSFYGRKSRENIILTLKHLIKSVQALVVAKVLATLI